MRSVIALATLLVCAASPLAIFASSRGVQVTPDEAHRRVDITFDGKPFTSYIWPETLKKPVLYPLITDDGTRVTRGFPLEPQPGERVDHPHQVGLWFDYGNANGFDFWNNSDAIKPENRAKMGTVVQTRIVSAKSGADRGELVVESAWITGANQHLMDQTTHYAFTQKDHTRIIDETITLKALDRVVFNDDKEGLFGMRVARWLESPDEKGGEFIDASGRPTQVAPSGADATGVYLTSEGAKAGAAWGTRGRWCLLTGHTGEKSASIAILDSPSNPDAPTYWHARGYGLFAANPLGRSIFDPKQPPLNLSVEKGGTVTFRYRVLISSQPLSARDVDREADALARDIR